MACTFLVSLNCVSRIIFGLLLCKQTIFFKVNKMLKYWAFNDYCIASILYFEGLSFFLPKLLTTYASRKYGELAEVPVLRPSFMIENSRNKW